MAISQNFPDIRPSLLLDFANSKTLDPRITFTRASVGTYVASNGLIKTAVADEARFDHDPVTGESLGLLIEEERTNLFKNSSVPFNDGRAVTDEIHGINLYTATANIYSGVYTSAVNPGNSGFMSVNVGVEYTVSFYAKKVDGTTVSVRLVNNVGGVLTDTVNTAIPSDGERVSVKLTCTSSGSAQLFLGLSPGLSVKFGGFQVEVGSFPTSYIPTSGSTVTREPDIATIEGNKFAKTNLLSYSERFDEWDQDGVVKTKPNAALAPDGTPTADLITVDPGGPNRVSNPPGLSSGSKFTFSFYFKNVDIDKFSVRVYKNGADAVINFDATTLAQLSNSAIATANVVDASDGWKRIIFRYTNSLNTGFSDVRVGGATYGGSQAGSFYIWGAQLEEGSELTEYTPSVETFDSRASSATYVDDATGLIKTTPVNLIRHSQDFSDNTNWANRRTVDSVTTETLDPLGGSTATKLLDTTDNNTHRIDRILPGGTLSANTTYTLSVFAKQAEYSHVSLTIGLNSNTSGNVTFDLNAGVKSSESAAYTGFIESAGGGWYRCIATVTLPSAVVNQNALIGLLQDASTISFAGTGTSGVYIWGAQLEENTSTASPYIKTGSTISGAARYENGELLLEPARTNLLTYSKQFDQWDIGGSTTLTSNATVAPDGSMTADRLEMPASGGTYIQQNSVITAGTEYTGSVWVKAVTPGINNQFNLQYGGNSSSATAFTATGEWQRVSSTVTAAGGGSLSINNRPDTFTTDIYIWGAQLEAAPYASSYIPTTSAAVTRSADVSTSALGVDSWYNQSEGTIFSDISPLDEESDRAYLFSNGSNAQRLGHNTRSTSSYALFMSRAGATTLATAVSGMPKPIKACLAYKPGSSRGIIDGQLQILSTITDVPININQVGLGCQNFNTPSGFLNGHITRLAYYPTRLPDDKLKSITT